MLLARRNFLVPLFLLMILFSNLSCSKKNKFESIAVAINDYKLTEQKFEELYREHGNADTPENREAFLKNLITRKLLLQEAQRRGLDTQKEFLKDIENFWEQSLLKSVVSQKVKEIGSTSVVSEGEIKDAYDLWLQANPGASKPLSEVRDLILWKLQKEKETKILERWTDDLNQKANIKVDKKAIRIE